MATAPLQFFVQLLGTRDGWPENMAAEEERVMNEHYLYLKDLTFKKKVLMAGPCFEPVFGLIVLQVRTEEEARDIVDHDPSISSGLMTYKMQPFHLSLTAHHIPKDRYAAEPTGRMLTKEVTVRATLDDVWHAWTTNEGIQSFFAKNCNVDLRIGGPFEMYFSMDAPEGLRGSEGCRILSYLPKRMLSFEWNAPPMFNDLRKVHTQVVLEFDEVSDRETRVRLTQHCWGKGEEWNKVHDYFDRAWSSVLDSLKERFSG